jgi:hypothetical protein
MGNKIAKIFSTIISLVVEYIFKIKLKSQKWYCAWCGEKRKLTIEKEGLSEPSWFYTNKDGSPDMRRKNFQNANYRQYFRCNVCNAQTLVWHHSGVILASEQTHPKNDPISSVTLIEEAQLKKDGNSQTIVERTAEDIEYKR